MSRRTHIVPLDDLREHSPDCDCWCRPIESDVEPDVWVHNSMDRRELYESGELRPS